MNKKIILRISLAVNIIGFLIITFAFLKFDGINYISDKISNDVDTYDENPYYIERTQLFQGVEIPENSTVFIGDSITQRGLWNELFPAAEIINRGINGDTTEGVLNRVDKIAKSKPEKTFLMIGINDLYAGVPIDNIVSNYKMIIEQLSGETEVYIQSVLPLNYGLYYAGDMIKNETIQDLNVKLEEISSEYGATYIDLNSKFLEDGQLNAALSYDGIHLNGNGYNVWKQNIEFLIN